MLKYFILALCCSSCVVSSHLPQSSPARSNSLHSEQVIPQEKPIGSTKKTFYQDVVVVTKDMELKNFLWDYASRKGLLLDAGRFYTSKDVGIGWNTETGISGWSSIPARTMISVQEFMEYCDNYVVPESKVISLTDSCSAVIYPQNEMVLLQHQRISYQALDKLSYLLRHPWEKKEHKGLQPGDYVKVPTVALFDFIHQAALKKGMGTGVGTHLLAGTDNHNLYVAPHNLLYAGPDDLPLLKQELSVQQFLAKLKKDKRQLRQLALNDELRCRVNKKHVEIWGECWDKPLVLPIDSIQQLLAVLK